MFGPAPAEAAKAASAIECTISLQGAAAKELAQLLGLSSGDPVRSLELGEHVAWAVYLLTAGPNPPLSNSAGQPKQSNTVSYSLTKDARPMLTIGSYWQDMGTALPFMEPGVYRFSSMFIPLTADNDEPWVALLRRLKATADWKNVATMKAFEMLYTKTFVADDGTALALEVKLVETFPDNISTWQYMVLLDATPKKPCR